MASVFRRKTDRRKGAKWVAAWKGADGKWHTKVAFTDKAASMDLARRLEHDAALVREGLVEPSERRWLISSHIPIGELIESYRDYLIDKGGTSRHAYHVAGVLARLFSDAGIQTTAEIAQDRIQGALGRLKVQRSARTCNHAMKACKAFCRWLADNDRIRSVPRGLNALKPFNENIDRRRERRALSGEELGLLLAAAAAGEPLVAYRGSRGDGGRFPVLITGPQRAALYRLAMGTGFRAAELRSLTPESFHLDTEQPTVTVQAAYAKNRKTTVQPIRRDLAAALRPILSGRSPMQPVLPIPHKTAKLLRHDLEAAGIAYRDERGRVVDFHALRHSYITHLINSGVNPKVVQTLARHSTITLTLDRYVHAEQEDLRKALEGEDE
jgi:integrase/recombinase XerD